MLRSVAKIRYHSNMCRLLAIIGSPQVKRQAMEGFFPLAAVGKVKPWEDPGHLDGWAVSSYEGMRPVYLARSPGDVRVESTPYLQAIDRVEAHAHPLLIVHFRKATCGHICLENVHPFTQDAWSFAHNGSVEQLEKLGPQPPAVGTSDSERLFAHWCAQGQEIGNFVSWTTRVLESCPYSSLTSFLSDGHHLLAYRRAHDVPLPPFREGHDPKMVHADYYELFHLVTDDGSHVICSERLPGFLGQWRALANGEALTLPLSGAV
jgi:predicted glutamine amidotransferase